MKLRHFTRKSLFLLFIRFQAKFHFEAEILETFATFLYVVRILVLLTNS